ncbi:MAG: hypothetical protein J6S83_05535 [Lachnospiraceae bacterium]|nr:hypothetical protein [Lachnospiraceae bacterium]
MIERKNKKPAGSFSKVWKLIVVLRKCSGKGVIGDKDALISPKAARILMYCGLLIVTGAVFAGVYLVQPYVAGFIGVKGLAQVLMLVFLILSFVLAIKDIVTVLYMADDLGLLLPMPFSAAQIVMAKLVVASYFPVMLSVVILNSVCLGYGIRAGEGVSFVIGTVLSSILIPVTGISVAALLIVILFRVFRVLRSRNLTVALGGIFTFGLTIAYIIFYSMLDSGGSEKATAAVNALSSVSGAFPNISFMTRFMFDGSIPGLLISFAVTLAVIGLTVLAVRAFYFNTALSMQNTGTRSKGVSKAALHGGKKRSALKALTAYEAKSARRNPAYMIYGFVMSFFWPVLFALPFLFRNSDIFGDVALPLDTIPALLAAMSFAMMASCFSCGFNILPGTAFSREGSSFAALRALPLDLADYYKSKRNFSLLVCSLGSVLYVVVLGIVCVAAGFISVGNSWTVLAGACFCFFLNLFWISLMLLKNSKNPRFNWDSEAEFSRKLGIINLIMIIIGVIALIGFFIAVNFAPMLNEPQIRRIVLIICAAASLVFLVLALMVNSLAVKKAPKNLMKIEAA